MPGTGGHDPSCNKGTAWLHQEKVSRGGAVWGQGHDSLCQTPQSCWVTGSPWRPREGIVLLCWAL